MLDDDIKKILIELNMHHFLDEDEKLQAVTVSDDSKKINISDKKEEYIIDGELWRRVDDEYPSENIVDVTPAVVTVTSKRHIRLAFLLAILAFLILIFCFFGNYFQAPPRQHVAQDIVAAPQLETSS